MSWRDLQASDSPSSPPRQGGLKVAHGSPKVVFSPLGRYAVSGRLLRSACYKEMEALRGRIGCRE
jgi:hypothetical protein